MPHVRVGYRKYHTSCVLAEPRVQFIHEVDHVGRAVGQGLVAHAVVSRDRHDRPGVRKPTECAVEPGVEIVDLRRSRPVLVLDVVCQRKVHQVDAALFEYLDPRFEDEGREIGRVHVRQRKADHIEHVLDPVVFHGAGVRLLRREVDAAVLEVQTTTQKTAQLVLRSDRDYLRPRRGEFFKQRLRAEEHRIVHHVFLARLGIEKVVPRYAVHRLRTAGHDRHVVRIRVAGHHSVRDRAEAMLAKPAYVGQDSVAQPPFEVRRIAPVYAHYYDGPVGPPICHSVQLDFMPHFHS